MDGQGDTPGTGLGFFEIHATTPPQRRFIAGSGRPFQLYLGGAGSGKTHGLMLKAHHLSLVNPGVPGALLGRTMGDVKRTLLPLFHLHMDRWREATGVDLVANVNKGEGRITLIDGTPIWYRGYDLVDKLRGLNLGWAVIDEIEHSTADPMYAFNTISDRVRLPCPNRQVAIATTPDGMRGVTQHFLDAQRGGSPRHYVVHSTVYDNPYLSAGYIEDMRARCSKRQWEQEGLGRILKPVAVILAEFDEGTHVVPYTFDRRSSRPYLMGVDFGTSHAYFCVVEYDQHGRWVLCYEEKHQDTSYTAFRDALYQFIRSRPEEPELIACDRAVTSEKNWCVGTFKKSWVRGMESKSEQSVVRGIEMVRYMLQPSEGPPRLYVSEEVSGSLQPDGMGIRGAIVNYRYSRDREGVITNRPYKDNVSDHPIDALRYLVVASADRAKFHGGSVLPCIMPTRAAA